MRVCRYGSEELASPEGDQDDNNGHGARSHRHPHSPCSSITGITALTSVPSRGSCPGVELGADHVCRIVCRIRLLVETRCPPPGGKLTLLLRPDIRNTAGRDCDRCKP